MATARSLIRRSLLLLGVLAAREEIPADQAADGLTSLNELVASYTLERFLIFHTPRIDVPLVPGQATYSWGAGGTIPSPRPIRLEGAVLTITGDPAIEWPVTILTQEQYELGIYQKGLTSTYPVSVYLEPSYPLSLLHVYFVPREAFSLGLLAWQRLTHFDSLDTEVSLPPGYDRLLRLGLAVEVSAEYGRTVAPETLGALIQAKMNIKATNTVVPTLSLPADVYGSGQNYEDDTAIYRG